MPNLIVSNQGEKFLLALLLKAELFTPQTWKLRLFKNNFTPTRNVVLADLTEATFSGYLPIDLDRDTWTDPGTMGGAAVSYYGTDFLTFVASSGIQAIYGYYVTDEPGTTLLWVQRFDATQTASTFFPVYVFPVLTGRSEYEPI